MFIVVVRDRGRRDSARAILRHQPLHHAVQRMSPERTALGGQTSGAVPKVLLYWIDKAKTILRLSRSYPVHQNPGLSIRLQLAKVGHRLREVDVEEDKLDVRLGVDGREGIAVWPPVSGANAEVGERGVAVGRRVPVALVHAYPGPTLGIEPLEHALDLVRGVVR